MISFSVFTLSHCSHADQSKEKIDFGSIRNFSLSEVIDEVKFIKLETNDQCLIGGIDQLIILNDSIYVLDSYGSKAIHVFDITGKYVRSLRSGTGPREFIQPFCFSIDQDRNIILLKDYQSNRLFVYNKNNFEYIQRLGAEDYPITFSLLPSSQLICYYYPKRTEKDTRQVKISDSSGKVISKLINAEPRSKIAHGPQSNFYQFNNKLYTYANFSNRIYYVDSDTAALHYELSFGEYTMPDESFFEKFQYEPKPIMDNLFNKEEYVRFMLALENNEHLVVQYYIAKEKRIGLLDKKNHKTINFKKDDLIDDLGIQVFPDLISSYKNYFVGYIRSEKLNLEDIKNKEMKSVLANQTNEDNPIVVLFKIREII